MTIDGNDNAINAGAALAAAEATAAATLRAAGVADPQREARLLARWATGLSAEAYAAAGAATMSQEAAERLRRGVSARRARQPLSQITGRRLFFGLDFKVTPDTLDPRPESETLVAAALAHLDAIDVAAPRVVDLGVGGGCLLLSVLAERDEASGLGVDRSAAALTVAEENARALGLAARARFALGDWLTGVEERFDALLCNPPYIPAAEMADLAPEVRDWEPRGALTDEGDGLEPYRRLSSAVLSALTSSGRGFFEIGAGAEARVAPLFEAAGCAVEARSDLDGRPRVLIVSRR